MSFEQRTVPDKPIDSTPAYPPPEDHCLDSGTLLGETGQVWIKHRGRLYQLRETRNGKLILTG